MLGFAETSGSFTDSLIVDASRSSQRWGSWQVQGPNGSKVVARTPSMELNQMRVPTP